MAVPPSVPSFVTRAGRIGRRIFFTIIAIFVFFTIFGGTIGTVSAGERGIRLRFGAVTGDVVDEGLYVKIPFVESIRIVDVRIQKEQVEASAASKDLQTVSSTVALNYHVDPERIVSLYRDVGIDFANRLIDPSLQEAVKASTAKFTAEELVTKREAVREEIKTEMRMKLQGHGILVDEFNIVNFDFSESFNQAIEAKVTAEQSALAAKNKLEQVKFEAEQRVAEAKGKAEAIRVESDALKESTGVLQLRALEKWNGVLPQAVGGSGALPFISIEPRTTQ